MRKSDGVRVDHEKKSDRKTVDHEKRTDRVRVDHEKQLWGKSSSLQRAKG